MKTFIQRVRVAVVGSTVAFAASACFVAQATWAADSVSTPTSATSPIGEVAFQTLGLGTQSGCTRAAKMLVTTDKEWKRVWTLHTSKLASKPSPSPPDVDWSRQAVVVLLGGEGRDASISINQIVRAPTGIVVFFDNMRKDGDSKSRKTGETRSFHFALIEKPRSPLRFQDLSNPECATCVLKPGE